MSRLFFVGLILGNLIASELTAQTGSQSHIRDVFFEKILELCFSESQDFEDALHSVMVSDKNSEPLEINEISE